MKRSGETWQVGGTRLLGIAEGLPAAHLPGLRVLRPYLRNLRGHGRIRVSSAARGWVSVLSQHGFDGSFALTS